jgi:hypothetical protein
MSLERVSGGGLLLPVSAPHDEEIGGCRSHRFWYCSRIPSALPLSRLLLARHYEIPGGSPILSTQSTASKVICAEVDGSAALRADAVYNGRFHVLYGPNWNFKPHTSPFKSVNRISWRKGSVGWLVVVGSASHAVRERSSGYETELFISLDLAAGACESTRSSKLRREDGVLHQYFLMTCLQCREVRNADLTQHGF